MISRFFVYRPIFAWVIAIVIILSGIIAMVSMPISQYPEIALPQVSVQAMYPGASAKTAEDSVTQIVEQNLKGIDHLLYMNSSSDSSGTITTTLTFDAGTNIDIAQVQVQNKIQSAIPLLPQQVQQFGVRVSKTAMNFLMVAGIYSDDPKTTEADISDYISANILDDLSRVQGVGETVLFGSPYSMRIWLDPNKLNSYNMTTSDVISAISSQNVQVAAGQLGGLPTLKGTSLNAVITAQSRLSTPEEFRNIILRNNNSAIVRLGDVAKVEIGAENYNFTSRYNGKPASGVAIRLAAGANALDTAAKVKARMEVLAKALPTSYHYILPYDSTPYIKLSLEEVVKTLLEAVVLVFLIMYLFMQNWRATIIPTIAVPVVLAGTFAILAAFGYSINTLTLFGIVLAIGLLVDDAIVVVENVERVMHEENLPPFAATLKSMKEITGALIGIALVLAAVFVPMAFFGGSQGIIYRQFSVALVSSMLLSVVVALVLTPALCATILKPVSQEKPKTGFFAWFNKGFDNTSKGYRNIVTKILGRTFRVMMVYVAIIAVVGFLFVKLPTAFLPEEDQGVVFTIVQLPSGATAENTQKVMDKITDYYHKDKAVASTFSIVGYSFSGLGQNKGLAFIKLKDFDERKSGDLKSQAVAGRAMAAFSQIREALVFAIIPPAVVELGTSSGFDVQIKDTGGVGHTALLNARNQILGMAAQNPKLMQVRPSGQEDANQFHIDIDKEKAGAMGVSLADINATINTALGGTYVNDFMDRNRIKKVYVQSDAEFRTKPEDINKWYVRNAQGTMVPFSSFATSKWDFGPQLLQRYNGVSSMELLGSPAPGISSGEAMKEIEKILSQLPPGISYEWTGLSLQERASGAQAPILYALSIFVVFVLLAALYESWSIPISIIMVIPLGVVGALLATMTRGLSNDIYLQVALLTIIGLSSKNAILIVEFAKLNHEKGMDLIAATLEAVRVRLRPIIMTSLAFTAGILPLFFSNGAGAGSHHSIGTGLVGGMLSATFLAIFFIPLFFVLIQKVFKADEKHLKRLQQESEEEALLNTPTTPLNNQEH